MGLAARLQDRAEEWIYRLNERDHWIFRLYDGVNEVWAGLVFRGLRRRAERLDVTVAARSGREARLRFLRPADLDAFAAFLAALDVRYLPPHGRDRTAAARALARRSYVPLGIFLEGRLVGYLLQRLFFPRRAVSGIWMLAAAHNAGVGRVMFLEAAKAMSAEGLDNYVTIPLDNEPSMRIALWCGWKVIRTNRRFHVLLRRP
jgi:hypothetical protein